MRVRGGAAAVWAVGIIWLVQMAVVSAGAESQEHDGLTADELFQQAIEIDPFPTAENSARKLALLDRVLEQEPSHRDALNYRINLLLVEGRFEEAERDLLRTLDIRYVPEAHFGLCMVRDHLAGFSESVSDCYRSVAAEYKKLLDKPFLDFRYLVALKMADGDDFPEAMERALLEEEPDSAHWGPLGMHLETLESDREELLREFLDLK